MSQPSEGDGVYAILQNASPQHFHVVDQYAADTSSKENSVTYLIPVTIPVVQDAPSPGQQIFVHPVDVINDPISALQETSLQGASTPRKATDSDINQSTSCSVYNLSDHNDDNIVKQDVSFAAFSVTDTENSPEKGKIAQTTPKKKQSVTRRSRARSPPKKVVRQSLSPASTSSNISSVDSSKQANYFRCRKCHRGFALNRVIVRQSDRLSYSQKVPKYCISCYSEIKNGLVFSDTA